MSGINAPKPAVFRARRRASRAARRPWLFHSTQGILGVMLLGFVVLVALVGPLVAPHPITQTIGIPGSPPSAAAPLGTDFLGRDVLSRLLHGGFPVLWLSAVTISFTYLIGLGIGMTAGLSRSLVDPVLMRIVDLVLVFPPLLLLLLLVSGAGASQGILIIGIVLVLFPGVARLVRTTTLEVSTTGYIEAAVARGETRLAIMKREVLPNIATSVLADLGVRFSAAVILAASISFLGLGSQPPAANWGLMISENRPNLATNPWGVLAPAILLALMTIGVNLLSDGYVQSRTRQR
jgi:peptide/nickel transport system permease protein